MLVNSFAKINLYLEVLARRPDGYHEIDTIFSTISLHDSLKFALTKKPGIKILCNIPELAFQDNLVYKIAMRVLNDFGVKSGVKIFLKKKIPIAAGLGGGSSNAAVTFLALNKLFGLKMGLDYAKRTAAEYGSDINFFFTGGIAEGSGRGECVHPLPDEPEMDLLLVNPGLAISSKEAYESVDFTAIPPANSKLWFNRLEEGVAKKYPVIREVIVTLIELGAERAMMSGSGSTCIAFFEDKKLLIKAQKHFQEFNMWSETVKTLKRSDYLKCIPSLS